MGMPSILSAPLDQWRKHTRRAKICRALRLKKLAARYQAEADKWGRLFNDTARRVCS